MSPLRLGYNLGHVLSLLDHIFWEKPYHEPPYGEFHTVRNRNLLQTAMSANLKVDPSAPVKSPETAALVNGLSKTLRQTLTHNHPASLSSYFLPLEIMQGNHHLSSVKFRSNLLHSNR